MEQIAIRDNRAGSFMLPVMNEDDFLNFSSLIYSESGIHISAAKKSMLSSRLFKRLKALDIASYSLYYDYLVHSPGKTFELESLINVVSTNKTEFFRENAHFDFLHNKALPELAQNTRFKAETKFYAWSAGCSTGEEPYTIAKVISEYLQGESAGDFSLFATDISTDVLEKAMSGVYGCREVESIPDNYKKKYLMKGKGPMEGFYKIVPELRSKVIFKKLNLQDSFYNLGSKMDFIFCRNVVIYFDKTNQRKVYTNLCNNLVPGGFLFIGHSETLIGADSNMKRIAPTVYQKISS
jgi:chemotaxis protein methyltransferase CheR